MSLYHFGDKEYNQTKKIIEEGINVQEDNITDLSEEGVGDVLRDVGTGVKKAASLLDVGSSIKKWLNNINFNKMNTKMVEGMKALSTKPDGKKLQAMLFNFIIEGGANPTSLNAESKKLLKDFVKVFSPDLEVNKIGDLKDPKYIEFVNELFKQTLFSKANMNTMMSRFKAYQSSAEFQALLKETLPGIRDTLTGRAAAAEGAINDGKPSVISSDEAKAIDKKLEALENKIIDGAVALLKKGDSEEDVKTKVIEIFKKKIEADGIEVDAAVLEKHISDDIDIIMAKALDKATS